MVSDLPCFGSDSSGHRKSDVCSVETILGLWTLASSLSSYMVPSSDVMLGRGSRPCGHQPGLAIKTLLCAVWLS